MGVLAVEQRGGKRLQDVTGGVRPAGLAPGELQRATLRGYPGDEGYGGKEQYLCLGDWKADPRALDTVRTCHCSSAGGNSGGPIVAASAGPETGSAVPTVIGVLSTTRSGAPFHADTWGVIAQQADAFAEQPPAHRARAAYTPGENTGHWFGGTCTLHNSCPEVLPGWTLRFTLFEGVTPDSLNGPGEAVYGKDGLERRTVTVTAPGWSADKDLHPGKDIVLKLGGSPANAGADPSPVTRQLHAERPGVLTGRR
ncbi:hypothetical protein ACFRJ1_30200 [Streptomyces sp. NPDC056773]|uniref:hypothetical protein n=1 Tax=unclassified Streptomyces TaxID=2593676 RepID=UPI0036C0B19D